MGNENYFDDTVGRNGFKNISNVCKLNNLRYLDVTFVDSLMELPSQLFHLPNLERVDCRGCDVLRKPPESVCSQGIEAVKLYFADLEDTSWTHVPIVSAAVIGSRMAGKTSMIRTLKHQKRHFTYRDSSSPRDEATRVFEVSEITAGDCRLRMFDFGGDTVYHVTYQLTIRPNYIPIFVVNMEQFDRLAKGSTAEEATRQLCVDYISHLYLACPKLGRPILLLTHEDKLKSDIFEQRKAEMLSAIEKLTAQMIEEEAAVSKGQRTMMSKILHLAKHREVFDRDDIFSFGSDSQDTTNIHLLLLALSYRCKENSVFIPSIWEGIGCFLELMQNLPFILVSDILREFPSEHNVIVLRYMHNEGRLLWFEKDAALAKIVFHNIGSITKVIETLFDHTSETSWKERINRYRPTEINGKLITPAKYTALVAEFLKTGVLDEAIYVSLFNNLQFPTDVATTVLQAFHMVCGPILSKPRAKYIIPYLAKEAFDWSILPSPNHLTLKVVISFVGLSPPSYVYHLLVVAFLNIYTDPRNVIKAFRDGAVISQGGIQTAVTHNSQERFLSIISYAPAAKLDVSWRKIINTTDTILRKLKSIWIASHPSCRFYCAHCLHTKEEEPDCQVDPDWYVLPRTPDTDSPLSERLTDFTGIDSVHCCNIRSVHDLAQVPSPLKYPCKYFQHDVSVQ